MSNVLNTVAKTNSQNVEKTKKGVFITFEGVEGSGKTTQAEKLAETLGSDVISTREPGGTRVSEQIRNIFLTSDNLTPMTELLLISAARIQHVNKLIRPALESNKIVICDRFTDATIAYQGYRSGIDLSLINEINQIATGGIIPDITFILDLPPEIGLQRQQSNKIHQNRLDKESLEQHQKIREGYLSIAKSNPDRIKLIDATQLLDEVHKTIMNACHCLF